MPDTVIKVENLSKRYLIGHQRQESYTALRDVMAEGAKSLARKMLHPFRSASEAALGSSVEEFWALKDVSFEFNQGDRVGIIGRNGAGKSTLLKILSRITEPTSGRVALKGRVASLLEVGTGFHPELTGRENVFLNGAILGMSRAEIKRKFDEIVSFAEVERFLDTPVKRYSSGMYVRLAFAVAAHLEPEVLIVDEVLAVGDAQFQKKCLGKMEEVGREGRTVLFVSHNLSAVGQLCDRVMVLERGGVVFDGDTSAGIDRYFRGAETSDVEVYAEKKLPVDEAKGMQLLRVSLKGSDGNLLYRDAQHDGSVEVEIEYIVRQPNQKAYIAFCLSDKTGADVLWQYDGDSEFFGNRSCGRFLARFVIPEGFLSSGYYFVRPAIVNIFGEGAIDYHGPLFHFGIADNESLLAKRGINWPSAIKNKFTWELKQLG